jgi:hypothetical protein
MPFKKGESGNIAGRPVGTPNKSTSNLRDWITDFLEENKDKVREDWLLLEPKDRIVLFEKLLKYSLPTLQSTTLSTEFESMTDSELDRLISELKRA